MRYYVWMLGHGLAPLAETWAFQEAPRFSLPDNHTARFPRR